jgi:hypothetical protein
VVPLSLKGKEGRFATANPIEKYCKNQKNIVQIQLKNIVKIQKKHCANPIKK